MSLSIHIDFNGECEEAFGFYAGLLGGRIGSMLSFGNSPMSDSVPPEWRDKIVHGNIDIQGVELTGFDCQPHQYRQPQGFLLMLGFNDEEHTRRIFERLVQKGEVIQPLQKTFWSPCYGIVRDRFGVAWKLNCRTAAIHPS